MIVTSKKTSSCPFRRGQKIYMKTTGIYMGVVNRITLSQKVGRLGFIAMTDRNMFIFDTEVERKQMVVGYTKVSAAK